MSPEDMETTLLRLGVTTINTNGDEIQGHCPAHLERTGHEDRNPSWFINASTGAHICFSCGWKGSLYSLISYITKTEYESAPEWLGSIESMSFRLSAATKNKLAPKIEEAVKITESMLSAFSEPPEKALLTRGLSAEASLRYEVKWDTRKDSWILPVRNSVTGELLGWQEKGVIGRFFNNYPKGVKKNGSLFGYQTYKGGDLIVVESPLDAVRLASVGVEHGVSTYGCSISLPQLNIIRGADRVIFAMDNDPAGIESSKILLSRSKELGFECWFFDYSHTDRKDVGGMSKSEIQYGIENAKHSVHGLKALRGN